MRRDGFLWGLLLCAALAAGCAVSGKAVIDQYQEITPNRFEGAVAVVLEDRQVGTVDDAGKGIVIEGFKRIKLLDRKAADCGPDSPNCRLDQYVCYDETWDEVELIEARTITPDGTVIEVDRDDMTDRTWTTWAIPDDSQRCFVWQMKGAVPGAIFEVRHRVRSSAIMVAGGMWFQDKDPVLEATYVADMPVDYPVRWKTYNVEPAYTEKKQGKRMIRTWTARDMSPVMVEKGMAAPDDIVAKLTMVNENASALGDYKSCDSIKTWEDAGRCWTEMIAERLEPTDPVKAIAKEIASKYQTETDRVRAVWEYMNKNIRYVGLEKGLAGFIPLSVDTVCTKKYGDCKAVAGLISVLCREMGIKADPISIGTRPQLGDLDLELPGFFYFNHSIARVEADGKVYWLDATHRDIAFGVTPARDQGVHVLVSRPGKPFVDFIPVQGPETNQEITSTVFRPAGQGGMSLEFSLSSTGNIAEDYRRVSQEHPGDRWKKWVDKSVAYSYPQASVLENSFSGQEDNSKPFDIRFKAQVVKALQPAGRGVSFEVKPPFKMSFFENFQIPKRRYPLDLTYKRQGRHRYEVAIPEGMEPVGLPKNVVFEDDFLKVERLSQIENNKVVTVFDIVIKVLKIEPEQYPQARKSFQKALDASSYVLIFEPGGKEAVNTAKAT